MSQGFGMKGEPMATTYRCGHRYSTPYELTAENWCIDCRHAMVGQEVRILRFGKPVDASANWTGGSNVVYGDAGMSCYAIDGKEVVGLRWEFTDRPAWIGKAVVVGWGADEEPLIDLSTAHLRRASARELQRLGVTS